MTGATWSLSAATLARAFCAGSLAGLAAFAPYAGVAPGFAEAFGSGDGDAVDAALRADGGCVAALWLSGAADVPDVFDVFDISDAGGEP
ncbi:hypothetical protein [Paraburkholderia lycopersici]|uniref:Uncharacterized protein n=1 Tax=Paraburkholderia lycopersici TaxID=416944 RepID=A0A1G6V156_9BURK|nr:hypothetical protein [Paraburkholderia lycopersici]SDD47359.1 hypothetical protein SAMN05421548_1205 [Paraburkholderia lycopersici]